MSYSPIPPPGDDISGNLSRVVTSVLRNRWKYDESKVEFQNGYATWGSIIQTVYKNWKPIGGDVWKKSEEDC